MRKQLNCFLALALAIFLLGLALPFSPVLAMPSPDISGDFECEIFEMAVRFHALIMPDEPITAADVASGIFANFDISRRGITSLAGIEHFTTLRILDASGNALTEADFSHNAELRQVDLTGNPLTSLNVTQNARLVTLGAAGTQLASLDLSGNPALDRLFIPGNPQLQTVDLSHNPNLQELDAAHGGLTSLDLRENVNLHTILLANNALTTLDLAGHEYLITLDVSRNALTNLNTTGLFDLAELMVSDNHITTLNVADSSGLMILIANDNQLQHLNLSRNPLLRDLRVNNNQLGALNVTGNPILHRIEVANNRLSALDVTRNELLTTLDASFNEIATLDLRNNTLLHSVNAAHNRLDNLDLTANTRLRELNVSYNTMPSQQALVGLNVTALNSFIFQPQFPVGTDITSYFACDNLLQAVRAAMNLGAESSILAEQTALITNLNLFNRGITRIDGLQFFTALERLNLAYNNLTHADFAIIPSLRELDVTNNDLTSLNIAANTRLERLWASNNRLEHINVTDNTALLTLDVASNSLPTINLSRNTALVNISAQNNLLTHLDLTANAALRTYDVRFNFMESEADLLLHPQAFITTARFWPQHGMDRDVSEHFACENFLAAIRDYLGLDATDPVTPYYLRQITELDIENHAITSLAGLLFFTNLERLYAANNRITGMDLTSNRQLEYLDVRGNWMENRDAITGLQAGVVLEFDPQAFSGQNITAQFACVNLLQAAREALGRDEVSPIGSDCVLAVTTLNLANRGITNTTGIANFTNLTELNLADNPITHIDLSQNIALQNLNVSGVCLSALNLQNNVNLRTLDASRNHLTQLNLQHNTQLQSVDVRQNFLENVGMVRLQTGHVLTLNFNPQNERTVTPPTCTVRGFTTWTSHCGQTLRTNETQPLGHLFVVEVVRPTFTQPGYTRRTCSRCGYSYTTAPLPPIALNYEPTLTLRYNQATSVFVDIARVAPELQWHTTNERVLSIGNDGLVNYGRARRGTATITAVCPEGITRMEMEVTVNLTWWQWIIVIFFFGWLWY